MEHPLIKMKPVDTMLFMKPVEVTKLPHWILDHASTLFIFHMETLNYAYY